MRINKSHLLSVFAIIVLILFVLSNQFREKNKKHSEIAGQPALKINADTLKRTIITPVLEQEVVSGSNILWCSTFQLAWNELCDLAGGPIQMESPPDMVEILNKKTASKEDLDEDSFVAMSGLAKDGIYEEIKTELNRKFQGRANPDLFDAIPQQEWIAYAYLFKELPFKWAFNRFKEGLVFEGYYVDSFGIVQLTKYQKNEVQMASQVLILDYNNNDNFIIELKTKAEDDRLILAKIPPQDSLAQLVNAVEKRIGKALPAKMEEMSDLQIPVLNFDILKEYTDLYGHPICSSNKEVDQTEIGIALQSVRFRLDETGAVLKSEGLVAEMLTDANLAFDKPFLILIKRRDAERPYFALWVGNTELLIRGKRKP